MIRGTAVLRAARRFREPKVICRRRVQGNISRTIQCGISLVCPEVKSLRQGRASLEAAFAEVDENNECWLRNAHIPIFQGGFLGVHEPGRPRRLLLHKKQILDLAKVASAGRGVADLVPTSLYWNERGLAKVDVAVVERAQKSDKRGSLKDRRMKNEARAGIGRY